MEKPSDHERFTEGDCHILAEEIHKLTGWPVYALHNGDGEPDTHCFVMAPGGLAIDIAGVCSVRSLVRKWGASGYVRSPAIWTEWGTESYVGSRKRAKGLAKHLVSVAEAKLAER